MGSHEKYHHRDIAQRALAIARCPECGKMRYLTRGEAKTAAKQLLARYGERMRPYRCGDYWHLTKQTGMEAVKYREQATQRRPGRLRARPASDPAQNAG